MKRTVSLVTGFDPGYYQIWSRSPNIDRNWAEMGSKSTHSWSEANELCFHVNSVLPWENMSTIREGHLRDLPHPSLNEVLKSNTYSAIKLLKTGKVCDFINRIHVWSVNGYLVLEMSHWFSAAPQVLLGVDHGFVTLIDVSLTYLLSSTNEITLLTGIK